LFTYKGRPQTSSFLTSKGLKKDATETVASYEFLNLTKLPRGDFDREWPVKAF